MFNKSKNLTKSQKQFFSRKEYQIFEEKLKFQQKKRLKKKILFVSQY